MFDISTRKSNNQKCPITNLDQFFMSVFVMTLGGNYVPLSHYVCLRVMATRSVVHANHQSLCIPQHMSKLLMPLAITSRSNLSSACLFVLLSISFFHDYFLWTRQGKQPSNLEKRKRGRCDNANQRDRCSPCLVGKRKRRPRHT